MLREVQRKNDNGDSFEHAFLWSVTFRSRRGINNCCRRLSFRQPSLEAGPSRARYFPHDNVAIDDDCSGNARPFMCVEVFQRPRENSWKTLIRCRKFSWERHFSLEYQQEIYTGGVRAIVKTMKCVYAYLLTSVYRNVIHLHITRILDALKIDTDSYSEDPLTLGVITVHEDCCDGVVLAGALDVEVEPALALVLDHVAVDDARSISWGNWGIVCTACTSLWRWIGHYRQTANKTFLSTFEGNVQSM